MPRAYYKPFTIYEEVCGWKNVKHITHFVFFACCSMLMTKMMLFYHFSPGSAHALMNESEREQQLMDSRMKLVERAMNDEQQHRQMFKRRKEGLLPPG